MKKQIIIGLSLLVFGFIQAQKTENYVHFNIGLGEQNLSYKLQNGTEKAQLSYTINAAYSRFFTSNWGLQTGLGLQSFGALSTLNYQSSIPNVVDIVGDSYEFRDNYKGWQEKQQALFIDIPLEAQYRHFFSRKLGVLVSAGAKISIPINASYKTVAGEMVTTGYYSKWNVVLHDLPQYGFNTYTSGYNDNLSLKPAYMAIADLGGLYKLSEKLELYVGGYINYGLNNIITTDAKSVYQPDGTYNGLFGSDQVSKVAPIAFGVKVGVYWKLERRNIKENQEPEIMPIKPDGANLNNQTQTKTSIISNEKVNSIESSTTNNQNVISKYADNKAGISMNVLTEDSVNKVTQQQEPKLSGNSIDKAKQIASSMNLNFGSDSVLQRLHANSNTIKRLNDSLKEDPNAILYILSQSDSVSIARIVNNRKDLAITALDGHSTINIPKKDDLHLTDKSAETTLHIGFYNILRLLNAQIESVNALSAILKSNPDFSPYILSLSNATSVVVLPTTKANSLTDETKDKSMQIDSDGDGVPDYQDKCPNTPIEAKGFVDKNGCPLDTDGDGIPDYMDKCPNLAGVASNRGCPEIKTEVRTLFKKALTGIIFETGKNIIKKESYVILDQIAIELIKNPNYLIEIHGHTDNQGDPQANKLLSELRAFAVRSYLIVRGVDGKRITSIGHGDTMPIVTNSTLEGRALNRRVEFIVTFEEVTFK